MAAKPVKVSQLNAYINRIIRTNPVLSNIRVTGEISNLKFHSAGSIYFSLKDETSKINCYISPDNAMHIRIIIEEGMNAIVTGFVNVYERGGTYSLMVSDVETEGEGSLSAAFNELKMKLETEGLFDKSRKKKLKPFPEKIAVVTSDTGAAVQDILKIIRSRNTYVDVYICPVLVQGPNAANDISSMIDSINKEMPYIDCIITGRGGGSVEELWAFNEEIVARSIAASDIPVISGVGHETDVTISDFVADVRAETPTAAAALAVPDLNELHMKLDTMQEVLDKEIRQIIEYESLRLSKFDYEAMSYYMQNLITTKFSKVSDCMDAIEYGINDRFNLAKTKLDNFKFTLEDLNPFKVLERGYSVITDADGRYLSSVDEITKGDKVTIHMHDGEAGAVIENTRKYDG